MPSHFSGVIRPLVYILVAWNLTGSSDHSAAAEEASPSENEPWQVLDVPNAWKTGAGGAYTRGIFRVWFRAAVLIPKDWEGRNITVFFEGADDAREIYFNGKLSGKLGEFPPNYRSGLGKTARFSIPPNSIRWGEYNWLAVRVCHREGRSGFNVAAPVLFAKQDAIRLAGKWEFRKGDELSWSLDDQARPEIRYHKLMTAADAERTLKKLDDDGPLSPQQSLTRFRHPADLEVEVCLADPHIGQPLSIKFDAKGRMWVMEYRQYPNPAGLKPVSRDKYLRTVYDKVPVAPPNHARGQDRISIHEDTNGDGVFDRHRVFVDGLSIATSFAIGRGGVWVLNPPYLLFYPDSNGDDQPDGDPQVHLQGFGIEDTHSVTNSLRWGPDGWLYAAQGSTVTGNVRTPGSKQPPVRSMGQLIWRYHPSNGTYEIFAEGGGNAFGVEFDAKGRVFSGHNGGNTRGFHYVQGGYLQKGFSKHGSLSNPYSYGYFGYMAHKDVPRFTHSFVVYQAQSLPKKYWGSLFAVAPLQGHVVISERNSNGSTFGTKDKGYAFESTDSWVRPVAVVQGPDGAVYIADFYEQRIDHASHFQGRVDSSNGRIYRIRNADPAFHSRQRFDLSQESSERLLKQLADTNRWFRETAQRILADRQDHRLTSSLIVKLEQATGQTALEYLWALHHCGGLDDSALHRALKHADPYVRLWAIRLAADDRQISDSLARVLAELATSEPHIEVRNQLACSAQRLPSKLALPIAHGLLERDQDAQDPYQPLCLWWLIERQLRVAPDETLAIFESTGLWQSPLVRQTIAERLMRRLIQSGSQADLLRAAKLLSWSPDPESTKQLMTGFELAIQGRSLTGFPDELVTAIAQAGGLSLELRLRRMEEKAIVEALQQIADPKVKSGAAIRLIEILGELRPPSAKPVLLSLAAATKTDSKRRTAVLNSLTGYTDSAIGTSITRLVKDLDAEPKAAAFALLSTRTDWTLSVLDAVDAKQMSRESVSDRFLRRAMLQRNDAVSTRIQAEWGKLEGVSTEAMYQQIQSHQQAILAADGNLYAGKQLFDKKCAKCHRLFEEGGEIGPDLTPYQRLDLPRMLLNVVNPSAEIREGFETHLIITADGRSLSGFIEDQDNRVLILKDAEGNRHTLLQSEVDERVMLKRSMMPERLLEDLSEQQIRDLFAYLRSAQPLP